MKVTLDTNILVSGTFWKGASFRILQLIDEGEIELVLSEKILEEYSAVLNYKEIQEKVQYKKLDLLYTIKKLRSIAKIIDPKTNLFVVTEDPDDNIVLECAVEGKVDFIVSNDKHLLKIKKFQNIEIVKPEELLLRTNI
tara:strand:- start:1146 stop:1562 length:417 start_codon:yes stop_codon:yes gene_type:complete